MQPQPAPAASPLAFSDNLARTVEGVVVDAGPIRTEADENADEAGGEGQTQRIDVQLGRIEIVTDDADTLQSAQGSVRIAVRWPQGASAVAPFLCGQTVQLVTQLLPPAIYRDPGVWSRRDYLLDQGITASGSSQVRSVSVLGPAARAAPHSR